MEQVQNVIKQFFKDDITLYFHQSDRHQMEEPNAYLRYEMKIQNVWIFMGSDNGEMLLLTTDNAEGLKTFLNTIVHGV